MSKLLNRKSVIKVKKYLEYIDNSIKLILLDETARTAIDAARSLDKQVGSIVKSLLFKSTEFNDYYLCLVSGDKYADIDKISILTSTKIKKASAEECKKFTGFSIGAVSPVAHDNIPKKIFIDKNLNNYEMVYAAAGHPFVVFAISYNKLCKVTKGKIENIVI
tara:strand:- start:23728 stop:24216 length:489 start_codon:yes stop_codon:yes gene_type:complete